MSLPDESAPQPESDNKGPRVARNFHTTNSPLLGVDKRT
jgi:hypothetical protein